MPVALTPLPTLGEQVDRLIDFGIPEIVGVSEAQIRAATAKAPGVENALLAINPDRVSASTFARFVQHGGKPGFVVEDMTDVDAFTAIDQASPPPSTFYLLHDIARGDDLANWSPNEALPAITAAGRTPLTLIEGIQWLLQQPEALERNHCFMTIGSRLRRPDGTLDARTPALWISNGTGRDGKARRHAPKVGWCWAGNRHTWLGFASAAVDHPGESFEMRPLRYAINVTLDGCCHHEAGLPPDEESMRYWTAKMERADALLFGRVTYEMMESAWRQPDTGNWPDWMDEWEVPFTKTIDRAKKYVVSSTLSGVDWNAELVQGDLGPAVQRLKQEPGEGLWVGGVTLPLALANLGLIDEYEFLVQPVLAGHGPTLLAGLHERIQLELVDRHEFRSGAVALRYRSTRVPA